MMQDLPRQSGTAAEFWSEKIISLPCYDDLLCKRTVKGHIQEQHMNKNRILIISTVRGKWRSSGVVGISFKLRMRKELGWSRDILQYVKIHELYTKKQSHKSWVAFPLQKASKS